MEELRSRALALLTCANVDEKVLGAKKLECSLRLDALRDLVEPPGIPGRPHRPELVPHITNALPVGLISPEDTSSAVLYLASEDGRYITGTTLTIDAGFANKV